MENRWIERAGAYLLSVVETMDSEQFFWHAIRVRSRSEKLAAAELSYRGHEIFAAIAPQRRVWADRVRVVNMPLFPGYIFGRFPAWQRAAVELAPSVVSVVRFGRQDAPVDAREIESLRLVAGSGLEVIRRPFLRAGSRVRVIDGPLTGAEGLLIEWRTGHQLLVSVDILQRSIAVEMDEAWVEPFHRPVQKQLSRTREAGAA